jgi:hypothetical protein
MLTFTLQCINSVVLLAAAILCLRVAVKSPSGNAFHDTGWKVVGVGFLWHATCDALQNAYGGAAIAAGRTSALWASYLEWLPVMNHSRTFLLDGLAVGLLALALYRRTPDRRFWRGVVALLAAGFAAGIALGVREGGFTGGGHYSAVAIWDVIELIALLSALFGLLLTNRADRLLWAFLAAYGLRLALGIFWFTVLAQKDQPGAWHPPTWTLSALRIGLGLVMIAAALRRLHQHRRGRPVHGMLGRTIAPAPMLR